MYRFRRCLALVASLLVAAADLNAARAGEPAAVLQFPVTGSVAGDTVEVEGTLNAEGGWPVLFVRPVAGGSPWWVQRPIEEVTGGRFSARIHLGNANTAPGTAFSVVVCVAKDREAAAGFKAGDTLAQLPPALAATEPIVVYRDARPDRRAAERRVDFSGRRWRVKSGSRVGPGPNDFSADAHNVWVDDAGHLHLAITKEGDAWKCAEVVAEESLGYGEYRWVISGDLDRLDPQVVLGLFTYETTSREIDFELSRWGDKSNANAQFVVQPYTRKGNLHRFDTGKANVLTCSVLWEEGRVRGRCWNGETPAGEPLAEWTWGGRSTPPPGRERARANLWLFDGKPPTSPDKQEVVIRSFAFQPAAQGAADDEAGH